MSVYTEDSHRKTPAACESKGWRSPPSCCSSWRLGVESTAELRSNDVIFAKRLCARRNFHVRAYVAMFNVPHVNVHHSGLYNWQPLIWQWLRQSQGAGRKWTAKYESRMSCCFAEATGRCSWCAAHPTRAVSFSKANDIPIVEHPGTDPYARSCRSRHARTGQLCGQRFACSIPSSSSCVGCSRCSSV